jgi:type IV pilus assembly protein PilM
MPMVPVSDLRVMLKLNPKTYLQQELVDYIFDCFLLPSKVTKPASETGKGPSAPAPPKCKVIVGGTRRQFLEDLLQGVKDAGLSAEQVVPNLLGPPNALEMAQPEIFEKEVVAVVDLGFKNSTISILQAGELMLNRVVGLGGDKLTSGLAESLGISYQEAEGIKVGMPQEVESNLAPLLTPLGRELRASIDFFEHQHDKTVSQIFLCGGAARSEFIMQAMENELMAPCKSWNPISFLENDLSPGKASELEPLHCQFAVAAGAAAAAC